MTDTPETKYVVTRLSVLMFLQFFVWGAWYLGVSLYMLNHGMGDGRYYAYTACPLAAIITPVLVGLIADRFFSTERVLALLFLLAGFFMLLLYRIGDMGDPKLFSALTTEVVVFGRAVNKGRLFNLVVFAHALCFMPTLGLTASLSFRHLPKGSSQFPIVRLWGTIGWIVAGFIVALAMATTATNELGQTVVLDGAKNTAQFLMAGGASISLGVYSLFLPRTPPPKAGPRITAADICFKDAWALFKEPSFAVFMLCSFLICAPLAAYYASLQQHMQAMGFTAITAWNNVGTFLEAGMMFMMPWFFRKLGIKKMILIGVGAWALRYVLFALGAGTTQTAFVLVVAGIALHGLCYDFFFVTGQVYVDQSTPESIRGQAQGLNIFFTQGLGMMLGAMAVGKLAERAFGTIKSDTLEALPLWPKLWWPLSGIAAAVLVLFAVAFHPRKAGPDPAPGHESR